MALKFKDLTRSLSVLSPRRSKRRRRPSDATAEVQVGEMGQLELEGVPPPTRSVSPSRNYNASASASAASSLGRSPSRLPFRLPSSTNRMTSKGSFTGSRRSRRKISITIAPEQEGRRILKLQRRRKNSTATALATPKTPPGVSTPLSRATSWVTLSTGRSPTASPLSLSPRSAKHPVPLELVPTTGGDSSSSSTTIVTPTSIAPAISLPTDPNAKDVKELPSPAIKTPDSETGPCFIERLFPPAEIERRPSSTKKPGPGRVYVFDVVSEESPTLLGKSIEDKDLGRPARLAKSAQRAPLSYRFSPWSRVMTDLGFLFSHLSLIPSMFVPCRRHGHAGTPCTCGSKPVPGDAASPVPPGTTTCRGHITNTTMTQVMLFVLSLGVTVMGIGSFLACMPSVAALLLLVLLAEYIQGETTRDSKRPDVEPVLGVEREAWFFVNGMTATADGTQEVIDHLHGLVRRPVTALMNRSLGLWFDFLQSVLQRNLFLPTRDLRHGYKYVHEAIMNPSHDRIVLVAHSQGGIIVSAWVDQLIADLHPSLLTRVEVYTFGSAASHFALRADGEGAFARIEHFANMHDLVAQFGVLNYARGGGFAPSRAGTEDGVRAVYGRYVGRVFARNRTGHMLLDHYLHPSDSILDEEGVKAASRFAAYVGGGNVLPDPSGRKTSAEVFATSVKQIKEEKQDTQEKQEKQEKRESRCGLGRGTPTGTPVATPTKSKHKSRWKHEH